MNAHRAPRARASGPAPARIPIRFPIHLPIRFPGRLGGWPRRLLAACLLLAAVATELVGRSHSLGPAPPAHDAVTVLAATRDLPAGSVLRPADVHPLRLPPAAVPAHALTPGTVVAGRRVAGPVRRGEALTDVRLVGAGLAAGLSRSGSVAVSVRLDDPAVAGLLRPGDRVDVLAAPGTDSAAPAPAPAPAPGPVPAALGRVGETGGTPEVTSGSAGQATVIASDVMVLAASPTDSDQAGGGLLVVAVTMPVARRLAGVSPENRLTVALRPP